MTISAPRNLPVYLPVFFLAKTKYKEKLQFLQKILDTQLVQSIVFVYICIDER